MKKEIKLISIAAVAAVAFGCQGTPTANTNANTANTASVNAANNANITANSASAATPAAANSGSAVSLSASSTPTEVYKAAYKFRATKDIEGLKKVMSKDVLDFLTMIGQEEKKSLDDELKEMCEKPQYSTDESRNEKITGDRATLEYRDEDGSWKTMDFKKEDGMWKMSLPGQDDDAKKSSK